MESDANSEDGVQLGMGYGMCSSEIFGTSKAHRRKVGQADVVTRAYGINESSKTERESVDEL